MNSKNNKLIGDFRKLEDKYKRQKVINMIEAIDASHRPEDLTKILNLIKQNTNIDSDILIEIYTSIIEFGDDMQNVKAKENINIKIHKLNSIEKKECIECLNNDEEELDNLLNDI